MTVVVATFGGREWQRLAESRAVPSALAQAPVVRVHGQTLAAARNDGLQATKTPWAIFLDADDEIEPGYVEAMGSAHGDLRAPSVRYIRRGRPRRPAMPRVAGHTHACHAGCLRQGNWLVIGTAVRTELLRQAGGWRDWPCYEDWDAFQRCWLAGATVEAVPDAIYRAHVRPDSRNRGTAREVKERTHRQIVAANFPAAAA